MSAESYLVVMDGSAKYVTDIPRGQKKYENNHPIVAIEDFLKDNEEFEEDPYYTRFQITSSPRGFLKRRSIDSAK